MKNRYLVVLMSVFLTVALVVAGCSKSATTMSTTSSKVTSQSPSTTASQSKVLKIGVISSITGAASWYGQQMTQGPILAAEEINASGQLPMKLEIVIGDHKGGDSAAGVSAMQKMMSVDKVNVVLSSWPNVSLAVAPIGKDNSIPVFNGGGVASGMIGIPWLHNTRDMDDQQLVPLVKYFVKDLGLKRIATIASTEPGSLDTQNLGTKIIAALGATEVDREQVEPLATDYRSVLAKIKAANPDGLLIWSWGTDISYTIKQAKEMGLNIPMGTILGIDPSGVKAVGSQSHEGLYILSEYLDPNSTQAWTQAFFKNYSARFTGGTNGPELYSANYYELVYVVKDAIKAVIAKGGNPYDGAQIEQAVKDIQTFNSLYGDGKMQLLPSGGTIKPLALRQYTSGVEKVIKVMIPPPSGLTPDQAIAQSK